jgi:hypothetical protein
VSTPRATPPKFCARCGAPNKQWPKAPTFCPRCGNAYGNARPAAVDIPAAVAKNSHCVSTWLLARLDVASVTDAGRRLQLRR